MLGQIINIRQDADNSMNAEGVGLIYAYDPTSHCLTLTELDTHATLIKVQIEGHVHAGDFIQLIEKTTQTQALMLSNHTTCDMRDIMSLRQLKSYLTNVIDLSWAAILIQDEHYNDFSNVLRKEFDLENVHLYNKRASALRPNYFEIIVTTPRGNMVLSNGFYMQECLSDLSRKIISDLLVVETSNNFQADAHRLLRLSSTLGMLALIIDPRFVPIRKMNAVKEAIHA